MAKSNDIAARPDSDSDAHLVARVLGGDRAAYGSLVARHQNAVIGFLCSRLRDRESVEDLAQETLVVIFRPIVYHSFSPKVYHLVFGQSVPGDGQVA